MKKGICEINGPINEENGYKCNEPNGRFRLRCKECVRARRVKNYYKDPASRIAYTVKWKKDNQEHVNEWARKDRKLNPEKYRVWEKKYYDNNSDKINARAVTRLVNLSLDVYYQMIEDQNNKCAICGLEETRKFKKRETKLCIDHNHKTGEVRALLCHGCNTAIGKFKENIELMERAIAYLKKHS